MLEATAFCVFTFLVQTITSQCIGGPYGPNGLPANGYVNGLAPNGFYGPQPGPYGPPASSLGPGLFSGPCLSLCEIPSSNGGGFRITSTSPITPSGVTVQTDSMLIEGPLAVTGQLPFLGVVALEGPLPVIGQGAVSYGCGDGYVGIVSEVLPPVEIPAPVYPGPGYGVGPGVAGLGFNGYPRGCGCNVY